MNYSGIEKLTKSEFPKFYHGIREFWLTPLILNLVFTSSGGSTASVGLTHSPHWQCLEEALQELFLQTFLQTPHLHFFFSTHAECPT
jgi:hypothetical protein